VLAVIDGDGMCGRSRLAESVQLLHYVSLHLESEIERLGYYSGFRYLVFRAIPRAAREYLRMFVLGNRVHVNVESWMSFVCRERGKLNSEYSHEFGLPFFQSYR